MKSRKKAMLPKRRPLPGTNRRATAVSTASLVRAEPLFPDGKLPILVTPQTAGIDPHAWVADNRATVDAWLDEKGGVLFRGFDIDGAEAFEGFVRAVSGEPLEYRERSSPRSQVSGNIYTSTDYPADQPIFLHNENSYQGGWPMKILFFCHRPPIEGGATPIADVRRVLERIDPEIRLRFERHGVMYLRNFSPVAGLPWQEVFQTDDRAQVEDYCRQGGLSFAWHDDGGLRTRSVRPAIRQHPTTGESVWFNHATFFHITTLPAIVRAGLLAQFGPDDLPSNSFYGDGTQIEAEVMAALRAAYAEETVRFSWQQGDILLLDNMLVAHGREPFTGPRKILAGMAQAISLDEAA